MCQDGFSFGIPFFLSVSTHFIFTYAQYFAYLFLLKIHKNIYQDPILFLTWKNALNSITFATIKTEEKKQKPNSKKNRKYFALWMDRRPKFESVTYFMLIAIELNQTSSLNQHRNSLDAKITNISIFGSFFSRFVVSSQFM